MANIAIVGSGNVGANTAFFIAESNIGDVLMFDVQDGIAAGKALDMMEAAPIRGYQHGISAGTDLAQANGADVVIITAGSVREPGMQREDLFARNLAVIDELAPAFANYDGTVVVATEPVDPMTMRFTSVSGLPPARVLGLGGVLDSTRLRHLIARETKISAENIAALVIGRHSGEMMPLPDYCRVNGVPAEAILGIDTFSSLAEETRLAGDLIVDMAQRASAYYGPSAAAADVAQAIVHDTKRILSVSTLWTGQYGISGVAMSLPAVIGRGGAERILEPVLDEGQQAALKSSATKLKTILDKA